MRPIVGSRPIAAAVVVLVACVVAGCDEAGGRAGFPAGVYEVTFQAGSSPEESPECLDQSLLISDLVTLFDGLTHFEIAPVDDFGEPTSAADAHYWGFIQCATADCVEDPWGYDAEPLLGSPEVGSLSGTSEMGSFGYSDVEQAAECFRTVLTSTLVLDEERQSVRLEFENAMVFVEVDYDPDNLDQLEQDCFDSPPEIPAVPCSRLEVIEGTRID
jgi:hypothetical protein